jgi:2-oxoglutarate ferredoxin oxidoreductase subunit alpha
MNMGQISREVQRVNQGMCTVVKHNRVDGQCITPDELEARLVKL